MGHQFNGHGECYCGTPNRINATNRPCRWDKTNWNGTSWNGTPANLKLTYALDGVSEQFAPALAWAWREWEKVCAIEVSRVSDVRFANIRYTAKRIDGPSGTLAWAELPCGSDRQLESRIDSGDRWHYDPLTAPARGTVHIGAVMCHENGHLLGLDHETDENQTSLLDPFYDPSIRVPQQWDIAQAVLRYGPPAVNIPPVDPGNPDVTKSLELLLDGDKYVGRVTKV